MVKQEKNNVCLLLLFGLRIQKKGRRKTGEGSMLLCFFMRTIDKISQTQHLSLKGL